mgnify:CR=1 FL=1
MAKKTKEKIKILKRCVRWQHGQECEEVIALTAEVSKKGRKKTKLELKQHNNF